MYLSVCTRPDITYVTGMLSQFNRCNDESHWTVTNSALRYLKSTSGYELVCEKSGKGIEGYVDAD
jgi:hypothetical protein